MIQRPALLLVFLACSLAAMSASASPKQKVASVKSAPEKLLGNFGAWHAYVSHEGGQTVCYMVTTKRVKSPPVQKRNPPYLMITHRPIEASTDVVSYGAGTVIESKQGVRTYIGKNNFEFFSVRDTAWARDSLTDHKIVAALRTMPVAQFVSRSVPDRKKKSQVLKDIFDLSGAPAAYHAIGKACGLPDETPKKQPVLKKKPIKTAPKKIPKVK